MLVVETIAKIRRLYFAQGRPIKVICRELGLSRNVVRKVIRSGATEFQYAREKQPLPKIGPWRERLDMILTLIGIHATIGSGDARSCLRQHHVPHRCQPSWYRKGHIRLHGILRFVLHRR